MNQTSLDIHKGYKEHEKYRDGAGGGLLSGVVRGGVRE